MTVSTATSFNSYAGNGSTTSFAYAFKIFQDSNLVVTLVNDTTGVETTQTLTTDYTVTGAGSDSGGSVVFGTAPASGNTVVIRRVLPVTQETNYVPNDPFPAEAHEDALDKLTMLVQQEVASSELAVQFPEGDVGSGINNILPSVTGRADKLIKFGLDGAVEVIAASDLSNAIIGANYSVDTFTGTGSTTVYTLSSEPGSKANTAIYIDGVYQAKANYSVSGSTLTFTTAPPLNSAIEIVIGDAIPAGAATTASAVSYTQGGTGAVTTNVQAKLRETVSVKDFGAVGDGDITETSPYSATNNATAFRNALEYLTSQGGGTLYIPRGQYRIETDSAATLLRVTSNVNIVGDGAANTIIYQTRGSSSVFSTVFSVGDNADVKTKTGASVTGATLAEFIADDFSKIQVENVTIRDIGVGMAPDVRTAGNQGLWITNARNVIVRDIANYGCSTPVSIGNDSDESCSNIIVDGIQVVEGGRWYTLYCGASQYVSVSNITQPKYASPNLGGFNVIRSQFVTLSNLTLSGETDGVTFTGNKVAGELHTSRNCSVTNCTFSELGSNGLVVFRAFDPADPAGSDDAGSTHHVISNITFLEANNCITLYTQNNFVSNIYAEGPIAGAIIDLQTNADNNTICLPKALTSASNISESGTSPRQNWLVYPDLRTDMTRQTPPVAIMESFGSSTQVGQLTSAFGTSLVVESAGTVTIRGNGASGDFLYFDAQASPTVGSFYPSRDDGYNLGGGAAANRWKTIYATTGTINTSDANEKEQIENLEQAELAVATAIKSLIKKFKYKSAVLEKGNDARIHVGVIAQDVEAAFAAQGLDAHNYGLFCKDTWYEKDGEVLSSYEDGAVEKTRLGVRYEELLAFVIAAM